jgi:RHS repeat-associated protein
MQKTGATGSLLDAYAYAPFGQALGAATPHVGFSSEQNDAATGMNYYIYRHLAPILGRWFRQDPLSFLQESNPYIFVTNNSINKYDYLGLLSIVIKLYRPGNQELKNRYYNRLKKAGINPSTKKVGPLWKGFFDSRRVYHQTLAYMNNYYIFNPYFIRDKGDCICKDGSKGDIYLYQQIRQMDARSIEYSKVTNNPHLDDGFVKRRFEKKGGNTYHRLPRYLDMNSEDGNLFLGGISDELHPGGYIDIPHSVISPLRDVKIYAICSCPCEHDRYLAQLRFIWDAHNGVTEVLTENAKLEWDQLTKTYGVMR